ncbi:peptidase [Fragilaria crotonensis]|nr:peptidase [Fragilaria crotonensis]
MRIKTVGRILFTALVGARAIHASNGTKVTDNHSRIVGGVDAEIGRYPFFVEWEGCGASLIHKDIILSAAHCAGIESVTVYVGSSRTFGIGEAEGRGVKRAIKQRQIHPSYQADTVDHDFLVMQLDSPVDMQPALLNEDGSVLLMAKN